MLRGKSRLFLALLLAGLAVTFVPGCSKYDGLERNMQYVSDELLRKDAEMSWREVNEAHAAWVKAGSSHEKDNVDFVAYQDAYGRYAVIYNELGDRQGNSFGGSLGGVTDTLPPPPPGMNLPPVAPKAPAAPAGAPAAGPAGRDLGDTPTPVPTSMVPVPATPAATPPRQPAAAPVAAPAAAGPASKPAATATTRPAGPGSYLIQPGDTFFSIAKRHGINEKRLMEANGITDPRKLAAGKQLTIPAP